MRTIEYYATKYGHITSENPKHRERERKELKFPSPSSGLGLKCQVLMLNWMSAIEKFVNFLYNLMLMKMNRLFCLSIR